MCLCARVCGCALALQARERQTQQGATGQLNTTARIAEQGLCVCVCVCVPYRSQLARQSESELESARRDLYALQAVSRDLDDLEDKYW